MQIRKTIPITFAISVHIPEIEALKYEESAWPVHLIYKKNSVEMFAPCWVLKQLLWSWNYHFHLPHQWVVYSALAQTHFTELLRALYWNSRAKIEITFLHFSPNKSIYRKTSNNVPPLIITAPLKFQKKVSRTSNNVRSLIIPAPASCFD